jgi:hypothetical protein
MTSLGRCSPVGLQLHDRDCANAVGYGIWMARIPE